MSEAKVDVYGASWCGDTRRTLRFLDENDIPYTWYDIDEKAEYLDTVIECAGKRKVPVCVFEDGTFLVEPPDDELADKLGL